MIELFERDKSGYIPELKAKWFLSDPGVAYRSFNGVAMRHTHNGWEYQSPLELVIGEGGQMWEWAPVYPSGGLWNMIRGKQVESSFPFVDQFESAESPYSKEYELGEYVLQLDETPKLIPERAEQISNLNDIDFSKFGGDIPELYRTIENVCWALLGNVDGVIFISDSGKAYLDPEGFVW